MFGFIDPPGRYVPKTQWRQFLAHMRRLPQHDPQVRAAIQEAHEPLASHRLFRDRYSRQFNTRNR